MSFLGDLESVVVCQKKNHTAVSRKIIQSPLLSSLLQQMVDSFELVLSSFNPIQNEVSLFVAISKAKSTY